MKKGEIHMLLSAAEKQILIAVADLKKQNSVPTLETLEACGRRRFCSYKLDWTNGLDRLLGSRVLQQKNNTINLVPDYMDMARVLACKYPGFRYWYNDWYRRADASPTHARLCNEAYGINLCQTGMLTKKQLDYLSNDVIVRGTTCLDLGCGIGSITEYITWRCDCTATGIDVIIMGIRKARQRTRENRQLKFLLADMRTFLPAGQRFDYIFSFDTIYFVQNELVHIIHGSRQSLAEGGKLLIYYSAWPGKDKQPGADTNRLGSFLTQQNIPFTAIDFSEEERAHWQVKHQTLLALEGDFAAEGNSLLFERRLMETKHFVQLAAKKQVNRYLYIIPAAG